MRETLLAAAASLLAALSTSAQSPLEAAGPLAINFDEYKDWNPALVFTDAFKSARPWVSQFPDLVEPWDNGWPLAADPNGWPLPGPGQAAATSLFHKLAGPYVGGVYEVLWEGTGTIEFGWDAQVIEQVSSHHVRLLVTPTWEGVLIKVQTSDPADPIRNIRMPYPGFAQTFTTQEFHPDFLAEIEPYSVFRTMQWQNTNFSTLVDWADRPTPQYYSQSTPIGMAVEHMVDLANLVDTSPWFCMPYLASDDFVRQFARYVAQNLDPDVPAYVEYSNEVWNGDFPAYHHAVAQGQAAGLSGVSDFDLALKWYSERSVEVLEIWRQEFELHSGPAWSGRLVRVISAQHANAYTSSTILDHGLAHTKCDALATGPYFGLSYGAVNEQWNTIAKTEAQILAELELELAGEFAQRVADSAAVAEARGLPLIAYEGGQHLSGIGPAKENQQLVDKLKAVNRNPGMYAIYRQFLDEWRGNGGGLMTPYSFCGNYTKWGSWGHLEYLGQPLDETHKLRALLDWAAAPSNPPQVTSFGDGCQGLVASASGSATVGSQDFTAHLAGALPGAAAALRISATDQDYAGILLPIDLSFAGASGCSVLVGESLDVTQAANGAGTASLTLAVPANPALSGVSVYLQWYAVEPGFGFLGVALSQGLEVTIGA